MYQKGIIQKSLLANIIYQFTVMVLEIMLYMDIQIKAKIISKCVTVAARGYNRILCFA